MKKLALFATIVCASLCWGQSMTSQKTVSTWNAPKVESSFNHCLTTNDKQNCWISIPGNATWISANAGRVVAVDPSGNGYIYNDGKTNSWTKHSEWGSVKEITYDDGNLYGLVHYDSAGKGYFLSKWANSKWNDISCCFQSFRMRRGVMAAYDINGTIWTSTNYGVNVQSHGWCAPDGPAAVTPAGLDSKGNATFYVACASGKIWYFDGSIWGQLPGSATEISSGPNDALYIVASSGDVQHWNGSGWDDVVTNKAASNLSVGGPFDVWMVGPAAPSGAKIWRFWENGALITHSYGGSVSCGQGVPQALCNTFTHQVHHQICVGTHCGPVSQSSWNGQGGWGPDAEVFATPYDLWTCLLAGEPAGPCGLAENEASMECSGGGSNNDNAPSTNWVVADSTDVMDFGFNEASNGPAHVSTGPYSGYWTGYVDNNVHENCYQGDPVPVCVAISPANITIKAYYWGNLDAQGNAYNKWWQYYDESKAGADAPYVYNTFYLAWDWDGAVINQICFGDPHKPSDFLYGNYDAKPHCK